jgi:hypothetical protein
LYSIIDRDNYEDTPKVLDLKKVANYDEINFIPIKNAENSDKFLTEEEFEKMIFG